MDRTNLKSQISSFRNVLLEAAQDDSFSVNEYMAIDAAIASLDKCYNMLGQNLNVLVGGFRISRRVDFSDKDIILEVLGRTFSLTPAPPSVMRKQLEATLKEIIPGDLIFVTLEFDPFLDVLSFCFAAHTNLVCLGDNTSINLYINEPEPVKYDYGSPEPVKYDYGSVYLNNAFLRYYTGDVLTQSPIDIFKYPISGFSFNYNFGGDAQLFIQLAVSAMIYDGETADLRAFSAYYKNVVDEAVKVLKEKRCKTIFTQWKKWKLVGSQYV